MQIYYFIHVFISVLPKSLELLMLNSSSHREDPREPHSWLGVGVGSGGQMGGAIEIKTHACRVGRRAHTHRAKACERGVAPWGQRDGESLITFHSLGDVVEIH